MKEYHINSTNRSSVQFIQAAFKQSWNAIAFLRCKATESCWSGILTLRLDDWEFHNKKVEIFIKLDVYGFMKMILN